MTSAMSFLLGSCTFLPCHSELCIVNASMVTVRCFVCTCEKHLLPELYLEERRKGLLRKVCRFISPWAKSVCRRPSCSRLAWFTLWKGSMKYLRRRQWFYAGLTTLTEVSYLTQIAMLVRLYTSIKVPCSLDGCRTVIAKLHNNIFIN